jgi:hypothetical protein
MRTLLIQLTATGVALLSRKTEPRFRYFDPRWIGCTTNRALPQGETPPRSHQVGSLPADAMLSAPDIPYPALAILQIRSFATDSAECRFDRPNSKPSPVNF